MKTSWFSIILLGGLLCVSSLQANQILSVAASDDGAATRMVVVLDQPTAYKVFSLSNPTRLVVDFIGVTKINKNMSLRSRAVKGVRHARHKQGYYRLVFDMQQAGTFQQNISVAEDPFQVQLFWTSKNTQAAKPSPKTAKKPPPATAPAPRKVAVASLRPIPTAAANKHTSPQSLKLTLTTKPRLPKSYRPQKKFRDVVVFIDPGHGGKDPGAIGATGVREKDVVLKVALRLHKELNQEFGVRAYLTRQNDQFVDLRARTKMARKKSADLFVSIHADALDGEGQVQGASVYVLSMYGASSEAARWVAAKEKAPTFVTGANIKHQDDDIAAMLMDLSQSGTIQHSREFAKVMVEAFQGKIDLRTNEISAASFSVLKAPDIPSVLIELGYLSNREDEKQLRSFFYQTRLATVLQKGILNYLSEHAPAQSWAKNFSLDSYTIQRGDTLWELSRRAGISVDQLRKISEVTSDVLEIGQVVLIPIPKNQAQSAQ